VKRLAASLTVASTNNGFSTSDTKDVTRATVSSYREAMAAFAQMRTLDVWYAHVSEEELEQATRQAVFDLAQSKGTDKAARKEAKKAEKRFEKNLQKARSRNSLQALSKLTEVVDGARRIISAPPVVIPLRELYATYGLDPEEFEPVILQAFSEYRRSLQPDRRALLEKFQPVDWARKVVGVGSVGTRAFIGLMEGRDEDDPLFLQIKEAGPSVLEGPLPRSRFRQAGERVVQGQRLMQASSDILLGWSKGAEDGRFFYWRQLRDMKGSAVVELMPPRALAFYGGLCGWTLARAHARSGDPVAIAAYLGTGAEFDRSVTDFALRYAEQNERDFAAFTDAVRTSRIEAVTGV
jgi:uncharacterized protein (DUF2252 family)